MLTQPPIVVPTVLSAPHGRTEAGLERIEDGREDKRCDAFEHRARAANGGAHCFDCTVVGNGRRRFANRCDEVGDRGAALGIGIIGEQSLDEGEGRGERALERCEQSTKRLEAPSDRREQRTNPRFERRLDKLGRAFRNQVGEAGRNAANDCCERGPWRRHQPRQPHRQPCPRPNQLHR